MAVAELFVVHHTHLEIGFTHDQPIIWNLYRRFIDRAIELAERDLNDDSPAAFRWTIEATSPNSSSRSAPSKRSGRSMDSTPITR